MRIGIYLWVNLQEECWYQSNYLHRFGDWGVWLSGHLMVLINFPASQDTLEGPMDNPSTSLTGAAPAPLVPPSLDSVAVGLTASPPSRVSTPAAISVTPVSASTQGDSQNVSRIQTNALVTPADTSARQSASLPAPAIHVSVSTSETAAGPLASAPTLTVASSIGSTSGTPQKWLVHKSLARRPRKRLPNQGRWLYLRTSQLFPLGSCHHNHYFIQTTRIQRLESQKP